MDIRKAFPSKYLKAGDLNGREVTAVMDRVEMEVVGQGKDQEEKPIVYFRNGKKGLCLNVTNSNTIAEVYGWDTREWAGKPVVIFETKTNFAGRMVDCLRVRVPTGSELRQHAGEEPSEEQPPPPEEPPGWDEASTEETPF